MKWAVARALAEGAGEERARALVGRVDPLLRGKTRRHLQRQVAAVLLDDPLMSDDAQVLHAVASRLEVEPASRRVPFWWATTLAGLVLSAALGVVIYRVVERTATL